MAYRYFILISYSGAAYSGWQLQPNASTVQQFLEKGLSVLLREITSVTGCGRTDAGVHARNYTAHFDSEICLGEQERIQLIFKLNRFLPRDIAVHSIQPVVAGAHARFSALWREYEYQIITAKDPFALESAYYFHAKTDVSLMNLAAKLLPGRHDFESFSKVHTQVNNFNCNIEKAIWVKNDTKLQFTIRADRFLRNMVRAIVGTLLDVGTGKITVDEFERIIEKRNRCEAGYSVPANGLTFTGVGYPELLYCNEPQLFLPDSSNKIISHYYTDPEFHKSSGNETNE